MEINNVDTDLPLTLPKIGKQFGLLLPGAWRVIKVLTYAPFFFPASDKGGKSGYPQSK
jgi:hypothetical protein